jgi:phage shock protein PspC (stress-responsive transcriptional regulator)
MKKTININLGGQAFIIDEPAFEILHNYFEALKLKFTNEDERREIIADIESRIAELFTLRLAKTRTVVSEEDVVYVISLMGKPEDIAGDNDGAPAASAVGAATSTSAAPAGKAERKFFRDPDDKKVAGVISGLCHYFGWSDPTWIRVALIAIVLLSMFAHLGLGVPLAIIYLILLIVVPEASTSAEKLQMQGKPVTLQNIEKEVRDAMSTAGNSVNTVLKDNGVRGNVSSVISTTGRILGRLFLVVVLFICVMLMLVLVASFFSLSMLSSASLTDLTHLLVSSRYIIMVFNVGLFLVFGIPLVSIMYDAIRYLANSPVKNPIMKRVLWGGWFAGLILLGFSSWTVLKDFAASDTVNDKVQLVMPSNGTLHVQMADTLGHALMLKSDDDQEVSTFVHFSGFSKTDYGFAFSDLKMEIAVSPDSNFYVERVAFSKGTNFADAGRNIQNIKYRFSQSDSILNLDNRFELPKEAKWRDQKIKIRIYVPEGKRITFAENVDDIQASVKGNDYFDDGEISSKTLQVEGGKIKCIDCKEKMIDDEEGLPQPPEAPEAPEAPPVPGKTSSNFNIHTGKDSDNLKDVTVNINQNGMVVRGKNSKSESVKVKINDNGISVTKTDSSGKTQKVK